MVSFVTGVTGQDGSYLAEQLLAEGVEVHGLVHSAAAAEADEHVPSADVIVHEGDLADPARMRELMLQIQPDTVYNLAGISSVAFSWREPGLTARLSGVAALELMESALDVQTRTGQEVRFVQAASAEIFGQAEVSPQDELTPLRPVSPYGTAKAMAHLAAHVYRQRGLHAVSCILYNHESPRRPPRFVTRKITRAVALISQGHQDLLELGNLDARRDWGWAPDYVDAMVRAARHDEPLDYVVATGVAHSVRDFVRAAFSRVGIEDWRDLVSVDPDLVRPADAAEQCGDASRARTVLGWEPTVSFEDLVGRMVEVDLEEPGMPRQRSGGAT
ncbi:GDP-mannose 4,6-dehydratase [Nocardioides mangrovicus]|uniref:GDP-mannose 4,6-dehydratase n=1 Tax=Nocardioides mangrovicus TaxID=2478913 RepID=A0A3L8NYK0_9ACTN|nr:GDP-mannose 4,6-dehydratase [Nocardioides mangrovicus]RLV47643.1 GDP-mannose 4,6-dehydratase [Nocardioides mangrovicus]